MHSNSSDFNQIKKMASWEHIETIEDHRCKCSLLKMLTKEECQNYQNLPFMTTNSEAKAYQLKCKTIISQCTPVLPSPETPSRLYMPQNLAEHQKL